ncbi:MAG TPA: hypothetical protein VFR75_12375 [Solirubrobacterales bacterium]|nr:hypothetical protein [Solirubrobacterales bacterium]
MRSQSSVAEAISEVITISTVTASSLRPRRSKRSVCQASSLAIAREEGWQTLRFERLGRRLVALAVTLVATVAGVGARRVATRRRLPPPSRFPLRSGARPRSR